MKKFLLPLAIAAMAVSSGMAQIVSSSPSPLFQDSKDVVITYRPNDGASNKTLANLPASTQLYAHVGVITSASKNDTDWKYASTWKDNSDKYKLTYVGPNEYTFNIGDINTFFGLPATEKVKKIVFVFRDATASKEGKTSTGGDISLPLAEEGMTYTYTPNSLNVLKGEAVTFNITNYPATTLSMQVRDNATMEITDLISKENATSLEYTHVFGSAGSFQIIMKGARTARITFTVEEGGEHKDYPGGGQPKMGPVVNSDGSVTFCIAAPNISSMSLVGDWDNWQEGLPSQKMNYCYDKDGFRYFWLTVPGLDLSEPHMYYYMVDSNQRRVVDPYSKLVLIKGSDNSTLRNRWAEGEMELPEFPAASKSDRVTYFDLHLNDYVWDRFDIPDHGSLFVYEMLFRDFTGDEGKANGNGTVRKAIEKIPYLQSLGVTAVELMPIMEFSGNSSWGYNPDLYMAPDKAYGSPQDYKDFINECHRNGIAVILDIVFNQTQDHPWYQMYPQSSNPFINAKSPHDYSVLNDWNQGNPIIKQYWDDVVKYWLTEYNVDGFRFDLVKGLGDNESYGGGTEAYNQSRVDNMKRIHAAMKSVKPNSIHINEFLGSASEEKEYVADGQLVWANVSGNSQNFMKASGNCSLYNLCGLGTGVDQFGRVTYSESHDEQRVAYTALTSGASGLRNDTLAVARRSAMLYAVQLLSPGPTMMWQFQELSAEQNTKTSSGNDMSNKKVIWSRLDSDHNGYRDVYATVCAVGDLRRANPGFFNKAGTYTYLNVNSSTVSNPRYMVLRDGDKEVVMFMNPMNNGSAMTVSVPVRSLTVSNAKLIAATGGIAPVLVQNGQNLEVSLAPNSFAVYATDNIAGIEDAIGDDGCAGNEVYGGQGEIVIIGDYNSAEVFNMQGISMGRLEGLDRGIYLVRVDGVITKVNVR